MGWMFENPSQLYSIHLRTCRFPMNLRICWNVRRVIEQNVSVLQHFLSALLCLLWLRRLCAKPFVLCVCEIFMHRSGDVLWDAPVVNASLPPSLFPSRCLSLCFVSLVHIIFRCSLLLFDIAFLFPSLALLLSLGVSPSLCYTAEEPHHCALHPLFQRPSIFQECLKIDCFTSSSPCTCKYMQGSIDSHLIISSFKNPSMHFWRLVDGFFTKKFNNLIKKS